MTCNHMNVRVKSEKRDLYPFYINDNNVKLSFENSVIQFNPSIYDVTTSFVYVPFLDYTNINLQNTNNNNGVRSPIIVKADINTMLNVSNVTFR